MFATLHCWCWCTGPGVLKFPSVARAALISTASSPARTIPCLFWLYLWSVLTEAQCISVISWSCMNMSQVSPVSILEVEVIYFPRGNSLFLVVKVRFLEMIFDLLGPTHFGNLNRFLFFQKGKESSWQPNPYSNTANGG